MANKDLKLSSHKLKLLDYTTMKFLSTKDGWWYEDNAGIIIVSNSKQLQITWQQLRKALKRKDKK